MLECLKRDGGLLPETQRANAARVIYACVSLNPEDDAQEAFAASPASAAQHMNEMYELTLRQEVLNEQAANIACEVMEFMIALGVDSSDESHPISALLRQVFKVKASITGPECDNADALERISGYLLFAQEYLSALRDVQKVA